VVYEALVTRTAPLANPIREGSDEWAIDEKVDELQGQTQLRFRSTGERPECMSAVGHDMRTAGVELS